MNLLSVENITKTFGERVIFKDVTYGIEQGQKAALVAKNGSGKSTLLRCLMGQESLDDGRVVFRNDLNISFLEQSDDLDPENTVYEEVFNHDLPKLKVYKEYSRAVRDHDEEAMGRLFDQVSELNAWDLDSLVEQILSKLKLDDHEAKVSTLSGGQKKRVALAKLLIAEPDFLILDEPTNHLDLDMIEWLEDFLSQSSLTLFMVTHDRYFLENVCNQIIELDRGVLYTYSGSYSDYLDKTKRLFQKELAWVRRQPKARGTKAKSRVDKFYDIKEEAGKRLDDDELNLNIKSARLGSKILEAHALQKSYDDKIIVDGFD